MKIELIISTYNLGDDNTADDNQRYVTAVQTEIRKQYPCADVSVELVMNVSEGSCLVSDDPDGDVREDVFLIANQVWDKADY